MSVKRGKYCTLKQFTHYDIVHDLTLAGEAGGLNRVFYAQTRQATTNVAKNRFDFTSIGCTSRGDSSSNNNKKKRKAGN